jgi:hypothetical protein
MAILLPQPDKPPIPEAGFEAELLTQIGTLVASLPEGVARLFVGRVPKHPEWPNPYFEVRPTKPTAARFGGVAAQDDLYLTVGEAEREFCGFARGANIVKGAMWTDELRWIWDAVIAGGFTQRHYLDSDGRVIGWMTKFKVNGADVVFRNGRRAQKLFRQRRVRLVTYESYF